MSLKYFKCNVCGKVIELVKDTSVPTMCCGEAMKELIPGTSDGATEKHVPVVNVDGNVVNVTIGEIEHPMIDTHYIEWIAIETKCGMQRKNLKPNDEPKACFTLCEGDEFIAAYAYCNIHDLWKK